eukprot:5631138-Pyramimonas_sp.AAC.1
MAEFVEDPIFALLAGLNQDDGSFAQAKGYIRAEFHSDDVPDGFTQLSGRSGQIGTRDSGR